MGPRSSTSAAALVALVVALTAAGSAPSARMDSQPRAEIIVGFEPGVSAASQRRLLAKLGATAKARFSPIRAYLATVPSTDRSRVLAALERDPRVRYAERNVRFRATTTPNDPSFDQLWALDNNGQVVNGTAGNADADIDAPEAWSVSTGSARMSRGRSAPWGTTISESPA